MIVPNLLGTVITTIQITTFYYFYCKLHGIPPERKEDDEQSPEQQKDGTTEQIGNTNDKPDNEQKLMADD